jgi:hypothetical protein
MVTRDVFASAFNVTDDRFGQRSFHVLRKRWMGVEVNYFYGKSIKCVEMLSKINSVSLIYG